MPKKFEMKFKALFVKIIVKYSILLYCKREMSPQ